MTKIEIGLYYFDLANNSIIQQPAYLFTNWQLLLNL